VPSKPIKIIDVIGRNYFHAKGTYHMISANKRSNPTHYLQDYRRMNDSSSTILSVDNTRMLPGQRTMDKSLNLIEPVSSLITSMPAIHHSGNLFNKDINCDIPIPEDELRQQIENEVPLITRETLTLADSSSMKF
jgi:hypothetical protein